MARISNRSIARIAVSFSAAAFVAVATALPSFADTSVVVGGSSLGAGGITFADFAVTLNGSAQTPTTSFTFADIVDPRGTGLGWNMSLAQTAFTNGSSVLPTGSLTIRNSPIISAIDPSSTTAAGITSTLTPGRSLDHGAGTPLKLLSAAVNGGMGSYNVSPVDLALAVPASAITGTYLSTATLTLTSAP